MSVSAEELDVLHAHDTRSLEGMLAKKEYLLVADTDRGLCGDWIVDEEARVSVIKSELARRGAFEF